MTETTTLIPADNSLERFDAGCDSALKFFDAPESYQFGQFVDLLINYDGKLHQLTLAGAAQQRTAVVADAKASLEPYIAPAPRARPPAAGFPLQALANPDQPKPILEPPKPETIEIDVDAFLAHPGVSINGQHLPLPLPESAVRALLGGGPLLASVPSAGGSQQVVLVGKAPTEAQGVPAADHWAVGDTAAFIANPMILSTTGTALRVPLSRDAIKSLRGGSALQIEIGGRNVTLIPDPAAMMPKALQRRDGGGSVDVHPGGSAAGSNAGSGSTGNVAATGGAATTVSVTPITMMVGTTEVESASATVPDQDVIVPGRDIPVTLFLPWEQTWTLQGYTRGRLVQSIGLGPLEETTIEIFSWDRSRRTLEQTANAETEQLGETTDTSRDASSVYNQLQADKEFELQGGGGLKATYRYGDMLTIDANASISASNKDKLAQLSKRSQDRLQESVVRASTRVKTSRTTKINESQETGREDRVTRRLKNPNRCSALTINYFDVHAAYDVTTEFLPGDTRLCVLVDNPVDYSFVKGDELVVRSHETVLRSALLDPALTAGFDGLRQVEARRLAKQLLDAADAERQQEQDAQNLKDGQSTGGTGSDDTSAATKLVADALGSVATAAGLVNAADVHGLMGAVDERPESEWRPKVDDLGRAAQRWLFKKLMLRGAQSLFSEAIKLVGETPAVMMSGVPAIIAAIDTNNTLSPDTLLNPPPSDVDELLTPVIQQYTGNGFEWNWWWGFFKDNGLRRPDDAGLLGRLSALRTAYSALVSAQQRAAALGTGPNGTVAQSQARIDALSSTDRLEMAFPVAETATAMERVDALMAHLHEFRNYYNYAILLGLPPVELLERLSAPLDQQSISVGMFEPRVVAMRGARVAIPLIVDISPALQSLIGQIIGEMSKAEASTNRVTLPTSGLVTDLRVGRCSGCEEQAEDERAMQLRALAARVALDELEAKRRQARLDANPPDLSPTEAPATAFTVRLEQASAAQP